MFSVATLSIVLFFSAGIQSEEVDISYEIADSFIGCAGFFDAAANAYGRQGLSASSEEYRGTGRGAHVVAQFFAMRAIADEDDRAQFLDAGYENAFIRHSAAWERDEIIESEAQTCFDLQPLQIEVLNMMRRETYQPSQSPD